MPYDEHVRAGVAILLGVLAFRAFPMLVAFVIGPTCSARQKLAALALYTLSAYLAIEHSDFRALPLLLAYVYLGAASIIPYVLPAGVPQIPRFLLLCTLFLVVPGRLVDGELPVIVLGWELVLCVHSYCRHVSHSARTLRDYWFFLFVNPTLAYPVRGTRVSAAGVHWRGLLRVGQGAVALVLAGMGYALEPIVAALSLAASQPFVTAALRLAALYAAHSGLASVQIGLFRQLGYVAPERYVRPYRSRSLRDFWARWNTYVGDWVRLYVFEPSIRALMKSRLAREWGRVWVHGLALTLSFCVVGALHDLYVSSLKREVTLAMTVWFTTNAAILTIGDAVAARLRCRDPGFALRLAAPLLMVGAVTGLAVALP